MIAKKINIATAKVIKLKLHVSVPGWPEKKPAPKNLEGKREQEIWNGPGTSYVPGPPGLYILNRFLKITKSAKAKI